MERKKVLIIGMFDSIHLARWLTQFKDQPIDFILFPSKKFKYMNKDLYQLIFSEGLAKYRISKPYFNFKLLGYFDFGLNLMFNLVKKDFRVASLKKVLSGSYFSFVHALEIQGSGYLYSKMPNNLKTKNQLILTNWGSDIYYFSKYPEHNEKIAKIVKTAAYYSAECERDYALLAKYEFNGKLLPCIPNGGGFKDSEFSLNLVPASERNLILCKGYGGIFGEVKLVLQNIEEVLNHRKDLNVFFYSVTKDVISEINVLKIKFGKRLNFSTVSNPLDRSDLIELFKKAKIYLGVSKSDGISTSFLEAITYGAYPIQTNTSCVSEWINKGVEGSVIGLNSSEILRAINAALSNDKLLNQAQLNNVKIASAFLSSARINEISKTFYGLK
jgi:hypothetical protein